MSSPSPLYGIFLIVYLLALVFVGALKARKIKTQADFSLAGRGLPTFVLVGTLLATWIGTGSIFGNAEETYRVGLAGFLLPVAGGLAIIALYFLAARIRGFGQFTVQDILEARFGVGARIAGTIALLLAYVIIVSYQYRAGSAVLVYLAPDLSTATAIYLVAAFVILYTALAGMFSVAYTDVANGIMMVVGIGLAIPFLMSQTGGFSGAVESLTTGQQDMFGHYGARDLINVLLPPFLLLLGDANMVQRFFAARSPQAARRSAGGMLLGVLLLECAIIAVAVLGAGLVAQGQLESPDNPAHIILVLAFEKLPTVLGAMLVATVVAVVVSTADSYLLSPSTSLVRDVYGRFLRPDAGEREMVLAGRGIVVLLGLVALGLAFAADGFFNVALFAYTIYGASVTPVFLAAFFWKRATSTGALSSMIAGAVTAIGWKMLTENGQALSDNGWEGLGSLGQTLAGYQIDAVLPAAVGSIVVLVVVSLLTSPPTEQQLAMQGAQD